VQNRVSRTSHHVILIDVIGPQTDASVRQMGREIERLIHQLRREGRPVLIIDNLKQMGETTPEARHEVARLARELDFDRGAMVGNINPLMRHGTNLMLRAIGRSNLRYFASFDGAYTWLDLDTTTL
jgi:hypothetical protein